MKKTSVALLTTLFAATIVHSSWAIGDVNVGGEGIEKISLSGMNIAPISRDLDVTNNLSLDATQIPTAMD